VQKQFSTQKQARREGEVGEGSKLPRVPRRLRGPAISEKYKIHQNAPFYKENSKKIPRGAPRKCLKRPTRMFSRASLWLSTGLLRRAQNAPKYAFCDSEIYNKKFLGMGTASLLLDLPLPLPVKILNPPPKKNPVCFDFHLLATVH